MINSWYKKCLLHGSLYAGGFSCEDEKMNVLVMGPVAKEKGVGRQRRRRFVENVEG